MPVQVEGHVSEAGPGRRLRRLRDLALRVGRSLRRVVRRRWRLGFAFLVAQVIAVTVASLLLDPVHQSSAQVHISLDDPDVIRVRSVQPIHLKKWDVDRYYRTQWRLMRSRVVLVIAVG